MPEATVIDHVCAKAWSSKHAENVAMGSSFMIELGQIYEAFYSENLP